MHWRWRAMVTWLALPVGLSAARVRLPEPVSLSITRLLPRAEKAPADFAGADIEVVTSRAPLDEN